MLRILFTNARGLTQSWRRAGFYEWIGKMDVQVVCVAEIKHPLQTTRGWHCVCHPGIVKGGVAVLVKKAPSITIERQGAAMNAAFVDIVHNCRFTRVVSVYCPCATEGPITELRDMVQAIPDTVVVGDWNACRFDTCSIKRMLLGLGYERLPNKVGATFIAPGSNKPSELDQALVRDKSWTVLDNPRWPLSDHFGILLACGGKEPRPVFRANMSLLKDKDCLAYIEDLASEMSQAVHAAHSQEERCTLWDQFKDEVKEFLLHIGARKARNRRKKDAELLLQIRELEKGRGACPETRALWEQVGRQYQERLMEKMTTRKRSWERTMLEGGHELFSLEAEEKSKGFALEGKTEDEMLAEAVPFYQNLFSKCDTSPSALSKIGYFIKHDEKPFSALTKPFDEEECLKNSKAMHVGKSPGPDGLPIEFWNKIWPRVVSAFVLICNEAHLCMPQSWKQGQVRLIPKKDKP